jgi:NAD(P)H-flavin reductase
MAQWFNGQVVEAARLSERLLRLSVDVPHEVVSGFNTPGQYHHVRGDPASASRLVAVGSAPGESRFEYFIRLEEPVDELGATLGGNELQVTHLEGPGFPINLARGRPLVMVATGTGFAPTRSVLEVIAANRRNYGPVAVLVGLHSELELPRPDELDRWKRSDLTVTHVISQPTPGWKGLTGRVQQHLSALKLDDAIAFLCGQSAMIDDVTKALAIAGLPPERVSLNLPS